MTNQNAPADPPFKEQPFVSHLLELRDRLLRAVAVVAAIFLCLFPFANDLYIWVASPLMAHLPSGTSMIATEVASPFLTPFKLSLVAAVFLAMPYILYQLWAFVAPGLYKHEKQLVAPLVASSTLLFYVGMAFAYYVVFPLVFAFLTGTVPDGVTVATDIAKYLDFILTLFFAFGLAFEVPIATFILCWMGVTTPEKLAEKRPYIIVGAFLLGMLLTPPDVISQTLLAMPMWLLFEAGLIFSRLFGRRQAEKEDENPHQPVVATAAASGVAAADGWRPPPDPADAAPAAADSTPNQAADSGRFVPLTEEELEAELDLIEASEEDDECTDDFNDEDEVSPVIAEDDGLAPPDAVSEKLYRIHSLRDRGDTDGARQLLYEVLAEGNADQIKVARNILQQLDER